jgi:hypothetical protein
MAGLAIENLARLREGRLAMSPADERLTLDSYRPNLFSK